MFLQPSEMDSWNISDLNKSDSNATNASVICTNEYCIPQEEYIAMIEDYIFPTSYEWILISFHAIVFIIGTIGNSAVCILVYRRHAMRSATNVFLANLAIADFMVIVLCLPSSVLWDVTNTWFFGAAMCKLVLYLQSLSVSVSITTFTFIAIDRWYAICYPLKFRVITAKVKPLIVVIWVISLLLVLPEVIFLDTHPFGSHSTDIIYFTNCDFTWTKEDSMIYQIYVTLVLYIIPLSFISVLYYQIVKTLWRDTKLGSSEVTRKRLFKTKYKNAAESKAVKAISISSCEGVTRSRRKAAKMLICVVIAFAVCYLPVHVINVLRYTTEFPQSDFTTVGSLIARWFCYANSAINPIIYNFMNGQFHKEFGNLFSVCCIQNRYFHTISSTISSRIRSSRTFSIREH